MHVCERFLRIPVRSVRAGPIRRPVSGDFDELLGDFGENPRFPGFSCAHLRDIATALHVGA